MNVLDDHDAPFDELTQLGERLRADADRRPADVGRLDRRIHASRQRARLALVTGCAAVVLVLAVAVGLRSGGEESLQVGNGTDGATLVSEAPATEPMWTVNPSMALDPADGEVWAIDVVYDPALWSFQQLSEDAALQQAPRDAGATVVHGYGMSGYDDQPRVQVYWQGRDARLVAEFAHDALVSRPGIVSVEVGPAKPTSYHPLGTGPLGSAP